MLSIPWEQTWVSGIACQFTLNNMHCLFLLMLQEAFCPIGICQLFGYINFPYFLLAFLLIPFPPLPFQKTQRHQLCSQYNPHPTYMHHKHKSRPDANYCQSSPKKQYSTGTEIILRTNQTIFFAQIAKTLIGNCERPPSVGRFLPLQHHFSSFKSF